jgi:hypothetical protein
MLPGLERVFGSGFAEALDIHLHQVPHLQCCPSGEVYSCSGGECAPESLVGDFTCHGGGLHVSLECYCEEQKLDCGTGGKPPAPVCSARWAQCQHPRTVADESLQAHLLILGMAGVLCGP